MFAINSIGSKPSWCYPAYSVSQEASPRTADTSPCGTVSPSAGLYQGLLVSSLLGTCSSSLREQPFRLPSVPMFAVSLMTKLPGYRQYHCLKKKKKKGVETLVFVFSLVELGTCSMRYKDTCTTCQLLFPEK